MCTDKSTVPAQEQSLQNGVVGVENPPLLPQVTSNSPMLPTPMPLVPPHILPTLPPYPLLPSLPSVASSSMAVTDHGGLPSVISSLQSTPHTTSSPIVGDEKETADQSSSASVTTPSLAGNSASNGLAFSSPLVMPVYFPYPPSHVMTSEYHQYLMHYQQLTYGGQMPTPWGYTPPTDGEPASVADANKVRISRSRSGTPVMDEFDGSVPVRLLVDAETQLNAGNSMQDKSCSAPDMISDHMTTQTVLQTDQEPALDAIPEPLEPLIMAESEDSGAVAIRDEEEEEGPPSPLSFKVLHYT